MSKHEVKQYIKNDNITALAIDSHAHLDRDLDFLKIVKNLKEDGLKKVVMMAGNIETAKWASKKANENNNLYYMFGLHPYDIDLLNDEYISLIKHLRSTDKKLVGLGEIGLDYHESEWLKPKEEQIEGFVRQLKIANELKLPVSIHIRDAHEDAIKVLNENRNLLNNGGIIHCCSAEKVEVQAYLNLGFHISFSGSITYGKKNKEFYLEETLKMVPLDKLLIETDCPFLCPSPYRGTINEPKYVLVTAEHIANVLGLDVNELINITTKNAEKLLKI